MSYKVKLSSRLAKISSINVTERIIFRKKTEINNIESHALKSDYTFVIYEI